MVKTCPNCGANLHFSPEQQKLVCGFCGVAEEIAAPEEAIDTGSVKKRELETYIYTCPQCAGELLSTEETAATFCSYCGASVVLEKRLGKMTYPKYIIPFIKGKEDCEKSYRSLLRRSLYVPSDMKKQMQIEKFRGIYMPYWTYAMKQDKDIHAHGSVEHRRGNYIITSHYDVVSELDFSVDGVTYDASSSYADRMSQAIAPYEVKDRREFQPDYISGFYADTADVDAWIYEIDAQKMVRNYAVEEMYKSWQYRRHGVSESRLSDSIGINRPASKLGMYPVWFLASRNKKGDRVSYAVMNGQTGKIAAEIPVDLRKFVIGSLLCAVPLFFLLNLFVQLRPVTMLCAVAILALISMVLGSSQAKQIFLRENDLEDKGQREMYAYRKQGKNQVGVKTVTKKPKDIQAVASVIGYIAFAALFLYVFLLADSLDKFVNVSDNTLLLLIFVAMPMCLILPAFLLPLLRLGGISRGKSYLEPTAKPHDQKVIEWRTWLSLIAAAVLLFVAPAEDLWYYGIAALMLGVIGWNFTDIIRKFNMLTTRKLPQLGKRGGDENA